MYIATDCSSHSATARLLPFGCSGTSVYLRKVVSSIHIGRRSGQFKTLSLRSSYSPEAPTVNVAMASSASDSAAAKVIDGKLVAKQVREEIAVEVSRMKDATGIVPGLAVMLVGDRKDSATYVRNKKIACESVGINSFEVCLPEDSAETEVLKFISEFNNDPAVHGILVQLPLPKHMNEQNILNAVKIEKDVDGFHPLNIGRLAMRGRDPLFVPCTPKGCIELLRRYGVEIKGKRAVVIGRSNIVGMPAALLLQREDATVTIVHSRTSNPELIVKEADIVISATGQANMVRGSWLKPGAVVIDVGINPVEVRILSFLFVVVMMHILKDTTVPRGYRLVGDVCYEEASKVASAITPVPGGVGPMTIAMLLSNTLTSAKRIHSFQ
ncbi:Bifunctional protein FolD 4, chloroplastic [Linum perenne]